MDKPAYVRELMKLGCPEAEAVEIAEEADKRIRQEDEALDKIMKRPAPKPPVFQPGHAYLWDGMQRERTVRVLVDHGRRSSLRTRPSRRLALDLINEQMEVELAQLQGRHQTTLFSREEIHYIVTGEWSTVGAEPGEPESRAQPPGS